MQFSAFFTVTLKMHKVQSRWRGGGEHYAGTKWCVSQTAAKTLPAMYVTATLKMHKVLSKKGGQL